MVVWGDLHTGDSKVAVDYLRGLVSGCPDIIVCLAFQDQQYRQDYSIIGNFLISLKMNISPSPSNSLNQQDVDGKHTAVHERSTSDEYDESPQQQERRPLKKRILAVLWDTFDKSPEERKLIGKLDWWILSYCCIAYFVKYLDQTNVSEQKSQQV